MHTMVVIEFGVGVPLEDVRDLLEVAVAALGSAVGAPAVAIEASHEVLARTVRIDTSRRAGRVLARLLLGLAWRSLGEDAVQVVRPSIPARRGGADWFSSNRLARAESAPDGDARTHIARAAHNGQAAREPLVSVTPDRESPRTGDDEQGARPGPPTARVMGASRQNHAGDPTP